MLDDDDAMEAIWNQEYSLEEITAPDKFKTYEQLQARLNLVLAKKQVDRPAVYDEELNDESEGRGSFKPNFEKPVTPENDFNAPDITPQSTPSRDEDEDDALSYFQKLADA